MLMFRYFDVTKSPPKIEMVGVNHPHEKEIFLDVKRQLTMSQEGLIDYVVPLQGGQAFQIGNCFEVILTKKILTAS